LLPQRWPGRRERVGPLGRHVAPAEHVPIALQLIHADVAGEQVAVRGSIIGTSARNEKDELLCTWLKDLRHVADHLGGAKLPDLVAAPAAASPQRTFVTVALVTVVGSRAISPKVLFPGDDLDDGGTVSAQLRKRRVVLQLASAARGPAYGRSACS
jgi:hypothetical protein